LKGILFKWCYSVVFRVRFLVTHSIPLIKLYWHLYEFRKKSVKNHRFWKCSINISSTDFFFLTDFIKLLFWFCKKIFDYFIFSRNLKCNNYNASVLVIIMYIYKTWKYRREQKILIVAYRLSDCRRTLYTHVHDFLYDIRVSGWRRIMINFIFLNIFHILYFISNQSPRQMHYCQTPNIIISHNFNLRGVFNDESHRKISYCTECFVLTQTFNQ